MDYTGVEIGRMIRHSKSIKELDKIMEVLSEEMGHVKFRRHEFDALECMLTLKVLSLQNTENDK